MNVKGRGREYQVGIRYDFSRSNSETTRLMHILRQYGGLVENNGPRRTLHSKPCACPSCSPTKVHFGGETYCTSWLSPEDAEEALASGLDIHAVRDVADGEVMGDDGVWRKYGNEGFSIMAAERVASRHGGTVVWMDGGLVVKG